MQTEIKNMISKIDRRKLTNNTQRALLALLTATTEWVPRTSINVPSVGARLRDLRKTEFGQFQVQCKRPRQLERKTRTANQTFYRLDPKSVTLKKVQKVFEGVISTAK